MNTIFVTTVRLVDDRHCGAVTPGYYNLVGLGSHVYTQPDTERHRQTDTDTDRDRQTQTHKDRDKQRQTETNRDK